MDGHSNRGKVIEFPGIDYGGAQEPQESVIEDGYIEGGHLIRPSAMFDIASAYEEGPEAAAYLHPDVARKMLIAVNAIQDLMSLAYNRGVDVGREEARQ